LLDGKHINPRRQQERQHERALFPLRRTAAGVAAAQLHHEVVERGTNDQTAVYRTRKLFLEDTVIPLEEVRAVRLLQEAGLAPKNRHRAV
jgi:hypothetical protein